MENTSFQLGPLRLLSGLLFHGRIVTMVGNRSTTITVVLPDEVSLVSGMLMWIWAFIYVNERYQGMS